MSMVSVAGFRLDVALPFLPDAATPLAHDPAFELLQAAERRRYNQLCGIMVLDQFIRFEHDVLAVVYERPLADGRLSAQPALESQVRRLVADEHRHRQVFIAVRQALLPGPSLVTPSPVVRLIERLLMSHQIDVRFWLWFGFAVEESGCALADWLAMTQQSSPGCCDPGYADLLAWHRADEIHHLAVDEAMLVYWHDARSKWRRTLDARLLGILMKAMRTPSVGGLGVVNRLIVEFPRLAVHRRALYHGVRSSRSRLGFQRWFSSPSTCPRWYAAMAKRPEMSAVVTAQMSFTVGAM